MDICTTSESWPGRSSTFAMDINISSHAALTSSVIKTASPGWSVVRILKLTASLRDSVRFWPKKIGANLFLKTWLALLREWLSETLELLVHTHFRASEADYESSLKGMKPRPCEINELAITVNKISWDINTFLDNLEILLSGTRDRRSVEKGVRVRWNAVAA